MSAKQKNTSKDHRQIAQEQELFFVHEYAPGAVFWMPKGWVIYRELTKFIREKTESEGYQEISTPVMVKNLLFKKSGHWEHFGEHNMFNLAIYDEGEITEGKIPEVNYSLKPMNCPEAALVFAHRTRSYKELPLKLSEFGILHRRELSGVLGGLLRVRQLVIDDAHLFVRPDQIMREVQKLLVLVLDFYKSLGFEPRFYLATKPDKAMGDPEKWKEAERDLEKALKQVKVQYEIKEKDGAFYGPKIDTHIKDVQDRDWQLATIQLDFMIPERMELEYIDQEGKRQRPVMIHRGIFGSFERFIGMLVEHYQGAFPVWLSPVQAVVMPITDRNKEYSQKAAERLKNEGLRVELDDRPETLQAKIRDAQLQKIPYMLVVGDKEEKESTVALRLRTGENLGGIKIEEVINRAKLAIEEKKDL